MAGGQGKRRRATHVYTPGQMLLMLRAEPKMTALIQHSAVWLAVTPRTAWVLDMCCLGQQEGGPATAQEVAQVLGLQLPPPAALVLPPRPAKQQRTSTVAAVHSLLPSGLEASASQPHQILEGVGGASSVQAPVLADGMPAPPDEQLQVPAAERTALLENDNNAGATSAPGPAPAADSRPSTAPPLLGDTAAPEPGAIVTAPGDRLPPVRVKRGRQRSQEDASSVWPWVQQAYRWVGVRLTLEEAFFLQWVLGCLSVRKACHGSPGQVDAGAEAGATAGPELTDEELWTELRAIRPTFPIKYVAYHHLRCKGWLPRSGLLYGVDYVTYALHPAAVHSHFSVLIVPLLDGGAPPEEAGAATLAGSLWARLVWADSPQQCEGPLPVSGGTDREAEWEARPAPAAAAGGASPGKSLRPCEYPMGWHDLQITARVVGGVAKKLLLLYVHQAPDSPGVSTLSCLQHFSVEERIVRRWVPEAGRE